MAAPTYTRQQLAQAAAQDAARYGLGPWFPRQINQESGFNPNAKSSAGAEGIAQFEPSTARSVGLTDPYDPIAALDAAARFDAQLVKRYGSPERALSAYNSGRPDAYLDPHFAGGQTYNYVRDILGGQAGAPPSPAPGLPTPTPLTRAVATPQAAHDFRPQLTSELAAAAGSQGNNLQAFYGTLAQALRARATASQQPPQPAALTASRTTGPAPVHGATAPSGTVRGDTHGEQAAFLADLARLAAFEHAPVNINSGFRSETEQAQLYANRASNPNPVAPPGHSLHEQGLAADGTVNGIPLGKLPAALLARFGLASVPGDPVHVQVRR